MGTSQSNNYDWDKDDLNLGYSNNLKVKHRHSYIEQLNNNNNVINNRDSENKKLYDLSSSSRFRSFPESSYLNENKFQILNDISLTNAEYQHINFVDDINEDNSHSNTLSQQDNESSTNTNTNSSKKKYKKLNKLFKFGQHQLSSISSGKNKLTNGFKKSKSTHSISKSNKNSTPNRTIDDLNDQKNTATNQPVDFSKSKNNAYLTKSLIIGTNNNTRAKTFENNQEKPELTIENNKTSLMNFNKSSIDDSLGIPSRSGSLSMLSSSYSIKSRGSSNAKSNDLSANCSNELTDLTKTEKPGLLTYSKQLVKSTTINNHQANTSSSSGCSSGASSSNLSRSSRIVNANQANRPESSLSLSSIANLNNKLAAKLNLNDMNKIQTSHRASLIQPLMINQLSNNVSPLLTSSSSNNSVISDADLQQINAKQSEKARKSGAEYDLFNINVIQSQYSGINVKALTLNPINQPGLDKTANNSAKNDRLIKTKSNSFSSTVLNKLGTYLRSSSSAVLKQANDSKAESEIDGPKRGSNRKGNKLKSKSMYVKNIEDDLDAVSSGVLNNEDNDAIRDEQTTKDELKKYTSNNQRKTVKLRKRFSMKLNKKSENKESESGKRLRDSGIISDLFHLGSMNNLKSKLNNATATLKNSLSVFNLKSSKEEEDIADDDRDDESSSSSCKNKSSAVLKFELTSLDGVSKENCANEEISKSTSPASTASSTAKSNFLIKMSASATNSLLIPTSLLNNNTTNEVIFQNNHNKNKNSDLLLSAKSPSSSQISQNNYFLEMNEANMKNDSKLSSNLLNMNNNANNKLKADFYNSKLLLFSSNMNNDSYFKNGKLNDARANINNNKNDEEKENDQDNYDKINEINDCKANTDDDDDEDEYYNDDDDGVFVEAKTTKSSINSNRNKKIMIDEPVVNKNKPLSLINSNASCNNKNKNNSNQDENKEEEEEKENCNNSILASFNNSLKNYDLLKASIFKNNSQQQQKEQSKNFDIVVAANRGNMILESSSSKDIYENESYLNTNTNKSKTKPINIANNSNYEFVNTHSNNSFLASLLKRRSSLTSSSSTSTSSTSSVDNTNSCSSSSATSFQSKFNSFKNAASKLDETTLGKADDQIVNENFNNLSLRRTTTFHSTTLNKDKKTSNKFDLLRSNNELGSMANLIEEKLIERRNKYLIENNKFFTGIPRPKVNYLDQNLSSQNKPLINSSSDVVKIKTYGSFVNSTAATKPGYIKNKINSNTLHTSASFSLNKQQQQQQHPAVNNSVSSYSAASSLLYSNKLPSSKTTSSFYHRQQHVNNENLSHSDKNSFRPIKTYENYSTNAIPNRTQLQQQQYELNALTSSMKAKNGQDYNNVLRSSKASAEYGSSTLTKEHKLNSTSNLGTHRHQKIVVQASTSDLLNCFATFITQRCSHLVKDNYFLNKFKFDPREIINWVKSADRILLLQGWQDIAFMNPVNIVFFYLCVRDSLKPDEIKCVYDLQCNIMACLYLAFSYMGNEISYPLKPFLIEENRDVFWQRTVSLMNQLSANMLRINQEPRFFTELFYELKSFSTQLPNIKADNSVSIGKSQLQTNSTKLLNSYSVNFFNNVDNNRHKTNENDHSTSNKSKLATSLSTFNLPITSSSQNLNKANADASMFNIKSFNTEKLKQHQQLQQQHQLSLSRLKPHCHNFINQNEQNALPHSLYPSNVEVQPITYCI